MSDPGNDHTWRLLGGLRDRPIVREARIFARAWTAEHVELQRRQRRAGLFAGLQRTAVAAVVIAALSAGIFTFMPSLFRAPQTVAFGSSPTEARDIQLDDGSVVQLNAASQVAVAFTDDNRHIDLTQGEARFEVAKDARRPFRVKAGLVEVVAVGTVFDVDARRGRTDVTLIEGRVDVRIKRSPDDPAPVIESLIPGQKITVMADGRILDKRAVRVSSAPAWHRGMVDLDDVPLDEALAELNRYSETKIVVQDQTLAVKPISGSFRMGDTKTIVSALEQFFGLKATWRSPQLVVLERP